ncbi:MAG: DUF1573 domain-containing protein [Phycisphaerae bacterium]|jgi:hypothetical protein
MRIDPVVRREGSRSRRAGTCLLLAGVLIPVLAGAAAAQLPPVPDRGASGPEGTNTLPGLFVEKPMVDIGEVIEGDTPSIEWVLENRGDAELIIERAHAGCGCTVVRLKDDDKVIPPGASLTLKVDFHSQGRPGRQTKGVTVFSNDPVNPMLKLNFTSFVKSLYRIDPRGLVNLGNVGRGTVADRSIELVSEADDPVEVLDVTVPAGTPLEFTPEPFEYKGKKGWRILAKVDESAALGTIKERAKLKLRIGDVIQNREVAFRGNIVGDMTWTPKVLDMTRHTGRAGTRFPALTIRSAQDRPFEILKADAGPYFDVSVQAVGRDGRRSRRGARYSVVLTIRDDAPAGPFGTDLRVRTDSLDQPLIKVPVYGLISPLVVVDPPLVVLRDDGTDVGARRRVKIQASPQSKLKVTDLKCDHDAVLASIDREARARYDHLIFLTVRLGPGAPGTPGEHEATLTVKTDLEGAERLEIPVRIQVPKDGR